ncbi:hypothetical protein Vadar_007836 [Vaccinium darrowii]|nr:hypothetical protein Vadar_007836 [Vaccinium darrowii]
MKHNRSLYLGRWQSSATHHIELANIKLLHGLRKLKSLTFLSLRGISMIMELPKFISELNDLMILDLRACSYLERRVLIEESFEKTNSVPRAAFGDDYCMCRFQEPGEAKEEFSCVDTARILKYFILSGTPGPLCVPKLWTWNWVQKRQLIGHEKSGVAANLASGNMGDAKSYANEKADRAKNMTGDAKETMESTMSQGREGLWRQLVMPKIQ